MGGSSTPATYMMDGRQYVVIATSTVETPKAYRGALTWPLRCPVARNDGGGVWFGALSVRPQTCGRTNATDVSTPQPDPSDAAAPVDAGVAGSPKSGEAVAGPAGQPEIRSLSHIGR